MNVTVSSPEAYVWTISEPHPLGQRFTRFRDAHNAARRVVYESGGGSVTIRTRGGLRWTETVPARWKGAP